VFRLYLAPFAEPLLGRARASLDLDDDDARTAGSLAALLSARGRADEAAFQVAESRKWAALAAAWTPRFDLLSLAAPGDAGRLAHSLPDIRVACVPNAVDLPEPPAPPPAGSPFTLLFVGTMGYLPNRDAAVLLATEVLPAVRRRSGGPIRLILAGGGADAELLALARPGEVEVTGRVADLRSLYAAGHVVLAPLRAGGGTRIKVLEAMAHARPVVATPLGAEGLAVEDGVHLLLGEDAEALADACCRILTTPELGAALAARGRALVARRYARNLVTRQIAQLLPHA
jgi:polysaccharide biosynthesis protein PslH